MNLTTSYMGISLKNPLVMAAAPITDKVDNCRKLEDAGVSALVLHSLFEEQIRQEAEELEHYLNFGTEKYAESLTFFPKPEEFITGPEEYLKHIQKVKKTVDIPVIASLNGCSTGGWTGYAKKIQQAGADAIELNIYFMATDAGTTGQEIEKMYISILKSVKKVVKIPVAVKISPYFSSVANMAKTLVKTGADGLVLFNRFYQPDINIDDLEVEPKLTFSTPYESRLPLRWIGVLYGQVQTSLAANGGIYQAKDMIRMIMAGADVTMVCGTILEKGIGQAKRMLSEMSDWMEAHEYESVEQMRGIMSEKFSASREVYERTNYMKVLGSYQQDI